MTLTEKESRGRRVLKLGGSLLTMPDVSTRVQRWLGLQPPAQNLMVVGGGELVEAVRTLDDVHDFDSRWSHWLCVDLLSHTSRLAQQIFPGWACITTHGELQEALNAESEEASFSLVDVVAFYSRTISSSILPENWNTTSDSIAAYLAKVTKADELVLLKSTGADVTETTLAGFAAWQSDGLVDDAFPKVAKGISRVRLVNLRAE